LTDENKKSEASKLDKLKVTENTTIISEREKATPVKEEEEEQRSK
jgi:hypothetical protein